MPRSSASSRTSRRSRRPPAGRLADAVKVTIYLVDLGHFARVNEIMAQHFPQPFPSRAAIGVASLPRGALVEADAVLVPRVARRSPGRSSPSSRSSGSTPKLDLVLHLPLRYEDETVLTPLGAARHGVPVLVEGEVVSSEVAYRPRKQLVLKLRDATGLVFVRFLNFYPSLTKSLVEGARVRLFGEVRPGFFGGEMVHPRFRVLRGPEPLPESLTPVYPATTAGSRRRRLRRLIDDALARSDLADTLPEAIRSANGLEPFGPACSCFTGRRRTSMPRRSRRGRTRRGGA